MERSQYYAGAQGIGSHVQHYKHLAELADSEEDARAKLRS